MELNEISEKVITHLEEQTASLTKQEYLEVLQLVEYSCKTRIECVEQEIEDED